MNPPSNDDEAERLRLSDLRAWSRARQETQERKVYQREWHRDRKAIGLHKQGMPGGGAGYPQRIPPWATAVDHDANKAIRAACPSGFARDHIVDPNHWKHRNAITGLEMAQNLQHLTSSQNQRKGSRLPDPDNYAIAAARPLKFDELRDFVRKGMAIWSKDVGDDGAVDWSLYQRIDSGDIIYRGVEPGGPADASATVPTE